MDAEMIKEMAESVNNVVLATAKPYQEQIRQLQAENKRLKFALDRYGCHDRECDESEKAKCICGFEQALKGE